MINQIIFSFTHTTIPKDQFADWVFALCFFGPLLAGIVYLIYLRRIDKHWEKGIFPDKTPFNRDNLLEAYICLAAKMIQKDRRDPKDKLLFVKNYFEKTFKVTHVDYSDSLSWAFKNPIDHKTVAVWINKHVHEETKRIQILYFLVGLSMIDQELIQSEYQLLKDLTPLLNLNQTHLDQIIGMYSFKSEEKTSSKKSESNKEQALTVLGLQITADTDDIKASYRKLVKIHHPDRFSNDSPEQQQLAHEKFLLIQKAYEYLID